MIENRLSDYLSHMHDAAGQACTYVESMEKEDFLADKRTQQAVILNIVIIGEAATKLLKDYDGFLRGHPEIPWHAMKGMRNRIAHGYFDINLDIVWDTVRTALPDLLTRLPAVQRAAERQDGK